jgi:hypothetical protein
MKTADRIVLCLVLVAIAWAAGGIDLSAAAQHLRAAQHCERATTTYC